MFLKTPQVKSDRVYCLFCVQSDHQQFLKLPKFAPKIDELADFKMIQK